MKKIAIVRRNGLGDLLCAVPLVRYFQKYEPGTHITLFVDPRNAPLIPYLPPIDRVVLLPNRGNKYLSLWRAAKPFRREFDVAFSAKTSSMKLMNFFLYALQATKRIAYVDEDSSRRLVNVPLVPLKEIHQALKGLKMVLPDLEEVPEELYPTLHVPPTPKPFSLPSPVVLVSATTTRPASRLDCNRYAELLNRLDLSVLVIGQPEDAARAHAIATHLKTPHVVHFPRNFEEFMVFVNAADCYFVGDGGVGHIGAALGKRGVVLYGETNPLEWRPLSKKVETFYHPTHVDHLNDEAIFQALTRMRKSGREN